MSNDGMSFTMRDLWDNELFPVGNFETIPVKVTKNLPFNKYPSIIRVFDVPNYQELYQEYLDFRNTVKLSPGRYIKERLKFLKLNVKDWATLFKKMGFNDKEYETYSMRNLGTNNIRDEIGSITIKMINDIGVKTFRQQYAVARPGWRTEMHVDTDRLDLHGFRVMIPLNTTFNIGFDEGIYNLEQGGAYFVNVAKPHFGINNQNEDRVNIMIHLSDDSLLNFDNEIIIK